MNDGIDIRCDKGDDVYAPFPGRIYRRSAPVAHGSCCDDSYALVGEGEWQGEWKQKLRNNNFKKMSQKFVCPPHPENTIERP